MSGSFIFGWPLKNDGRSASLERTILKPQKLATALRDFRHEASDVFEDREVVDHSPSRSSTRRLPLRVGSGPNR